jgi:hypothetical protein
VKNTVLGPRDDLDASAADVDAERGASLEVDRGADSAEDEVRLGFARDDADADARRALDLADERSPVGRFADGARRNGLEAVHRPAFRDLPHRAERLDAALPRFRREGAAVEASGPELHHLLFLVDDAAGAPAALDDDHVDGVRADVDRR